MTKKKYGVRIMGKINGSTRVATLSKKFKTKKEPELILKKMKKNPSLKYKVVKL